MLLRDHRTAWMTAKQRARQYRRDEDGSLIIFSLFIFLAMLIFGGVAVDLMLYEDRRTHVQNSTDRAVLAAANLNQTFDPKEVVKDYLSKVGITVTDDDISVVEVGGGGVITGRQVSVTVGGGFDTVLMNLVGVDTLPYNTTSGAEQAIKDVEVSLVLDISGSMGAGNKLDDMQEAAKAFLDDILAGAEDDRVSVSLVPYSTQVSAGSDLLDELTIIHSHDYSHCANFEEEDFETTAIHRQRQSVDGSGNNIWVMEADGITPALDADGNLIPFMEPVPLSQTASFDPWRSYRSSMDIGSPVCRDNSYFDITPWSNNATALKDQIDDFRANGNTSIDVAVKWGAALLDPSMNDALNNLIPGGGIDNAFSVRPHPHNGVDLADGSDDFLKFIVVMTDGINTTQYELEDKYKEGLSPYFRDPDGDDDILVSEEPDPGHNLGDPNRAGDVFSFLEPGDRDGSGGSNELWYNVSRKNWKNVSPAPTEQLTWLEAWHNMPISRRAFAIYDQGTPRNANHFYDALEEPRNEIDQDEKNDRLADICQTAKDQGIVIFSIGFEVTNDSAAIMEACASSENHFYRVSGEDNLDIEEAFASIANQINQLKLTK
ncbi:VWA domain-containing protein [Rhodobacteraceae bacterium]|nr:VWA domain-containing protein [Paracoccaceae bacterium]